MDSNNSNNDINIYKYKYVDIKKINITDFEIKYDKNNFFIQSPIFIDYEIQNINFKKYMILKFDYTKPSHIKFLTLIDSLEIKLNNYIKNKIVKTQIITNIQDIKSLKTKLSQNTVYFDMDKNKVNKLHSNKISLLFKLEFYNYYYSWNILQILQLN
jgi:hypothetical protein